VDFLTINAFIILLITNMSSRQARFTQNINNPILKTINASSGLMEFATSTDRHLDINLASADSGHGLATEAKQDTQINATNRDINNTTSIGDGSSQATALCLGYDRTNGKGRAILVDDGGRIDVNCLGNTDGDGSGDVKSLHLDGSGNVQTNVVNTVNVAPANSVNSGITDDPANSLAVGLRGRTDIADAATETFLLTDSSGHLQVDVLSSVGGDTRIKGNDGNDGAGTDRVVKTDANGVLIVDGSASTQPVSASSLPLPTGAATSALQTTGNTSLATIAGDTTSIDGKITACNTGAVVISSSALPAGAATEATLSNAEAHLGTIDTSTAGIVASHYADGDAIGGTDTGVLIMGKDNSNNAHPVRITSAGDVEVEIADFVKGQAAKAASFPVVIASDQDTLAVEESYTYSSDFTIINAVTIADGANSTSAVFEIQSVKVEDPIITFTTDSGGSSNYDVQAIGSHDGTNFFDIGFAKSFTKSEMSSTSDMGLKVPRYMKFKISNNHGSGSHTFTLKGAGLGITLATP
jgi:hypothetical protein